MQLRALPDLAHRRGCGASSQNIAEPGDRDNSQAVLVLAGEGDNVVAFRPGCMEWRVIANLKQLPVISTEAQGLHGGPKLDSSILVIGQQFGTEAR